MARYIDADALIKKIFPYDVVDPKCYTINAKMIYQAIQEAPTADVVPKSEVEELKKDRYQVLPDGRLELLPRSDVKALKKEVEMLQGALKAEERHNELTMEMAQKALQNAKAEVAREFIDAVDQMLELVCAMTGLEMTYFGKYAELKKKYTGDQSDG